MSTSVSNPPGRPAAPTGPANMGMPACEVAWAASLGPAWPQPAHGAQQAFRTLLSAMAHPGRIHRMEGRAAEGVEVPARAASGRPAAGLALAVCLLTLVDSDTTLHLAGDLGQTPLRHWLRFHTGVRWADSSVLAAYVACHAADAEALCARGLEAGSDAAPEQAATLLIDGLGLSPLPPWPADLERPQDPARQPPAASRAQNPAEPAQPEASRVGVDLLLGGPGIASSTRLRVSGLADAFWAWRQAQERLYPCGIDLILCAGDTLVALPRSTRVRVLDAAPGGPAIPAAAPSCRHTAPGA